MPRPLFVWRASSPSVLAPRGQNLDAGRIDSARADKMKRGVPTGRVPWESPARQAFEGLLGRYFG
ncbi:hypothetical protein CE91St41_07660 [Oscillospiraceae bacterium]|nr:hypothetical protein CE91St40_07660 [Oscillospiraceae bacterium]BDF73877.1 hypothetical protein CE91St41_07660 [Oscillospiraceae bacterium]